METFRKILLVLLFILIANAFFMVLQAQSNQLPLLAFNGPIVENTVQQPIEEEELFEKTLKDFGAKEIDHILMDNEMEQITIELWSNKNGKLVATRTCSWGDDIFLGVMNQKKGNYTLLLKSEGSIIKSYQCNVGGSLKL